MGDRQLARVPGRPLAQMKDRRTDRWRQTVAGCKLDRTEWLGWGRRTKGGGES